MALQADGRILVGGYFTQFAGAARKNLARLNPDGSIDESFQPSVAARVECLAVLPHGKILLAGLVPGLLRSTVMRLLQRPLLANTTLLTAGLGGCTNKHTYYR